MTLRCRQRFHRLDDAQRACHINADWCGGVTIDNGIRCVAGEKPRRYELRSPNEAEPFGDRLQIQRRQSKPSAPGPISYVMRLQTDPLCTPSSGGWLARLYARGAHWRLLADYFLEPWRMLWRGVFGEGHD